MSGKQLTIILTIFSIILVGVLVLFYLAGDEVFRIELLKEVANTVLQLLLIGILGAIATFLLDQYAVARRKTIENREREKALQEARQQRRVEALNTLTTLYWQIRKAFFIIDANQSAKSYGEQMKQIVDYWIDLKRFDNEVAGGMYFLKDYKKVADNLNELDQKLKGALREWEDEYWRLSRLQIQDEKKDEPSERKVPEELKQLLKLSEIRQDDFKSLHDPFERAARPIREQLLEDLTNHPK